MARTVDPAKHAAKRQQILDGAAALFAEQGYDRTTTSQLCAHIGISPGNLYHYFAGKKQVFLAVLTQDEQDTRALLGRLTEEAAPLEALLSFVHHLAKPATADPLVPKLVLEAMLQAHRDPEVSAELSRVDDDEAQALRDLLRRAAAAGEADPLLDVDEAAAWIGALISALYLQSALSPDFDAGAQITLLGRTVRGFLAPAQSTQPDRS